MLSLRKAGARFHTQIDWLDSWHSFSFGEHYDPRHMGFGPLRVINDDRVMGGGGFPTHPHRDMEIITIVLEGALAHKDSIGTGSVIQPGDVQKMSAGSGIRHSEFNASETIPVHLLQIWIMPSVTGIAPEYQQIHFEPSRTQDKLCLIAAQEVSKETIRLYQDAKMYLTTLTKGKTLDYTIPTGRKSWVQLAKGAASVNDIAMVEGDGLAATEEKLLTFKANSDSTILLFDLGD